jgi:hypothetical protein
MRNRGGEREQRPGVRGDIVVGGTRTRNEDRDEDSGVSGLGLRGGVSRY